VLPQKITAVPKNREDLKELPFVVSPESIIKVLSGPTEEYPLKDGKTTYYVCRGHSCLPPANDLSRVE
jgi:uncharacterized protein YyaL (SSP411 family)